MGGDLKVFKNWLWWGIFFISVGILFAPDGSFRSFAFSFRRVCSLEITLIPEGVSLPADQRFRPANPHEPNCRIKIRDEEWTTAYEITHKINEDLKEQIYKILENQDAGLWHVFKRALQNLSDVGRRQSLAISLVVAMVIPEKISERTEILGKIKAIFDHFRTYPSSFREKLEELINFIKVYSRLIIKDESMRAEIERL